MLRRLLLVLFSFVLILSLGACAQEAPEPDGEMAEAPAAAETARRGGGRDEIRIVGSSTVYPFSTKVAERFGRKTAFKTPVVESTGTGGGFKLFCGGIGIEYADVSNASRAIESSEIESCAANGVDEITEVQIGYDGIVVANARDARRYELSRKDLFLALAKEIPDGSGNLKENPYRTWSDIDPSLPDVEIEVYGPPPTSGTRDAFVELVMEAGCSEWKWIAVLEDDDSDRFRSICHSIREDGAFIEAGENDNLIVQKLEANPDALGIFGFSFLDQNRDKIQGSVIDGVEPTFERIAAQEYPVSRPLFFYVKKAHVGVIPGIEEYVAEFVSDAAVGRDGYLTEIGLIPLPPEERERVVADAMQLVDNVN